MKLKDLLTSTPIPVIEWRSNDPLGKDPDGIFCGLCTWNGKELLSLDGDIYSPEEEIYRYEWYGENNENLTYWSESKWEIYDDSICFRENSKKEINK